MKNNRDSFKSGKKPFSRDSGNSRDGGKKYSPSKPNKSGGYRSGSSENKPSYSSQNQNRYGKPDRPERSDKFNRFDRKPDRFAKPEKKFDKKFERKPDRFEKKPDRFAKPERKFEKKFERKPERKFERREERPAVVAAPVNNIVEQENSGMVYGRNAVMELLKSGKSIDKLFVQNGQREGSITKIFSEAVRKAIPVIEVEKIKLDSMINNSAHQGVIAMASEKEYCSIDDILKIAEERGEKPFILIADKIMDPHNLGAIIRTAECAGVHGIVIPKRRAAGVSPIVTKTSAGASIHMAVAKVANIVNTIEELKEKGIWIFSSALDLDSNADTDMGGEEKEIKNYDGIDYNMPLALAVGNEGEGLSPVVLQKSDFLVKIPMLGAIESLNVSCASAVLMYEVARQRKK